MSGVPAATVEELEQFVYHEASLIDEKRFDVDGAYNVRYEVIKKRIDKEVHDVFRHGIVHGSVINFDNVIVASKAWNLLFALDDWAKATIKAQRPVEPEPQLREVFAQLAKTQRLKQGTEAWEPQSFSQSDAGFNEHEIAERTRDFMNAWKSGNYGMLATFQRRMLVAGDSPGAQAGQMRDL